jgi:hypothetical protein
MFCLRMDSSDYAWYFIPSKFCFYTYKNNSLNNYLIVVANESPVIFAEILSETSVDSGESLLLLFEVPAFAEAEERFAKDFILRPEVVEVRDEVVGQVLGGVAVLDQTRRGNGDWRAGFLKAQSRVGVLDLNGEVGRGGKCTWKTFL